MPELLSHRVSCPYCGEHFEALLDSSEVVDGSPSSAYIEDCYICCRPIHFCLSDDGRGGITVATRSENE